jgi:hypothetical protein
MQSESFQHIIRVLVRLEMEREREGTADQGESVWRAAAPAGRRAAAFGGRAPARGRHGRRLAARHRVWMTRVDDVVV